MFKRIMLNLLFCMTLSQLVLAEDRSDLGNDVPTEHPLRAWVMYMVGKRALVYHGTRNKQLLDSIMHKGLYSCNKVLNDSSIGFEQYWNDEASKVQSPYKCDFQSYKQMLNNYAEESDFIDSEQVFFAPENSLFGRLGNLGMIVDPKKTYVFNGAYKTHFPNKENIENFRSSKMLLSEYLKKIQKAREMQQARSDMCVMLDEKTGEPYYVELGQGRTKIPYIVEVPYNADHISARRLIMMQDESFDVEKALFGDIDHEKDLVC